MPPVSSSVRPAPDAAEATWLLARPVAWWDLVRYGPPGFAVHVRVAFEAARPGDDSYDAVQDALTVLAAHTTSTRAYAAIWEGWGGRAPAPRAPRLAIPERAMLLFTGALDAMRFAPSLAWHEEPVGYTPPHLVWPADRSWCLACEVDEELAFSVGCTREAAAALAEQLPVPVRTVAYGAPEPLFRDS